MTTSETNNEYTKFKFQWKTTKEDFRQLAESSKVISRRFWTTSDNNVLEWSADFSLNALDAGRVDLVLQYVDGPLESVRFRFSMVGIYPSGKCSNDYVEDNELLLNLCRGEKFIETSTGGINLETGAYLFRIRLLVSTSSVKNVDAPLRTLELFNSHQWMTNLHTTIENADSKHSDVRLVSGDGYTFYCHRVVLVAQSDAMDAMIRNARTEEEKKGTFRLSAWSTEELRKILSYFYGIKPDLESSSSVQLMNIYDFGEQHGLGCLKTFVRVPLWNLASQNPTECASIARFADLHAESGLNSLKYRCFDVLIENYSRLGTKLEDIFKVDARGDEASGPPSSKKRRGPKKKDDEVGIRLKSELMEYSCGRIEAALSINGKSSNCRDARTMTD